MPVCRVDLACLIFATPFSFLVVLVLLALLVLALRELALRELVVALLVPLALRVLPSYCTPLLGGVQCRMVSEPSGQIVTWCSDGSERCYPDTAASVEVAEMVGLCHDVLVRQLRHERFVGSEL